MINADDVLEWITAGSGDTPTLSAQDTVLLERVVDAVVATIARKHTAPTDPTDADWLQAHLMQAARIWGRKDTSNGIGGFGEFGAVRVTRLDPDVATMLEPFRKLSFA